MSRIYPFAQNRMDRNLSGTMHLNYHIVYRIYKEKIVSVMTGNQKINPSYHILMNCSMRCQNLNSKRTPACRDVSLPFSARTELQSFTLSPFASVTSPSFASATHGTIVSYVRRLFSFFPPLSST